MGTDIYTFAELHDDDGWKPVPDPIPDEESDYDGLEPAEAVELGRSYSLFSVLCGNPVSLFAKNDEIPAIASERGFPEDLNPLYAKFTKADYSIDNGDQ